VTVRSPSNEILQNVAVYELLTALHVLVLALPD